MRCRMPIKISERNNAMKVTMMKTSYAALELAALYLLYAKTGQLTCGQNIMAFGG